MNEERIKKIFKKYEVDFKGIKFLQKQLINKKIHRKTIRNFIYQQEYKVQTVYCILKGSVQVFYTLTHEIKQKIIEDDNQKELNFRNPRFEQQKIIFFTVQGEFQILNGEILIKVIQNQDKRKLKKQRQKDKKQDQSDNFSNLSQSQSKKIQKYQSKQVKSKYSAIVTSSECEYIELSLNEAKVLLKERVQFIIGKEMQKQKVIQQSKKKFKVKFQQILQENRISQIAMANISSKLDSPKNIFYSSISKTISEKVILQRQKSQNSQNQRQFLNQTKRIKSISLLNLNIAQKNINKKEQTLPLLNNFKNQLELFNQNQLILQKYRSRKAFQKFSPSHRSHYQKAQNLFTPISYKVWQKKPINRNQDKLFKQNLKKIIKKKLNFQKKYGQAIKQFAYGTKPTNNQFLQQQQYDRAQIREESIRALQKSYSMDKLKIVKVNKSSKYSGPKINSFGLVQQNQQRQKQRNRLVFNNDLKNGKMPKNLNEIRPSLNRGFQQPIQEFMELQRMKKKQQQESLFLRLENLDNYFNKLD